MKKIIVLSLIACPAFAQVTVQEYKVERGHRLVADDLDYVTRHGNGVLMGRGHEMQRHHMEIRGIGIVEMATREFGTVFVDQAARLFAAVQWLPAHLFDTVDAYGSGHQCGEEVLAARLAGPRADLGGDLLDLPAGRDEAWVELAVDCLLLVWLPLCLLAWERQKSCWGCW